MSRIKMLRHFIPSFQSLVILLLACLSLFLSANRAAFSEDFAKEDYKVYKSTKDSSPKWDHLVEVGFQALDQENTTEAIASLLKATNVGCASPLVYFKLALAYEASQSYYSALQYYELAKEGFEKQKIKHRYRDEFDGHYGRALYNQGNLKKALPYLEKAAQTQNTAWILQLLGQIKAQQGQYLEAAQYFERLLQHHASELSDENKINYNLLLARTYRNEKDKDKAKLYYNRILEIDASNREAQDFIHNSSPKDINLTPNKALESVLDLLDLH